LRVKQSQASPTVVIKIAATKIVLLILGCVATAQQQTSVDPIRIDTIVGDEIQKQHLVGVTVAIAQDGRIVYSKAFGSADLENNVAATTGTLIRTGSLAKPITAVAAMTLVDSGKLDLDASVRNYCPSFPEKQWTVTTRQLLNHSSGIRDYNSGETDNTRHYGSMSEGFAIFAGDDLKFQPGTRYQYSTYGYSVLGCVIEGAAKQKYFDYLQAHVLAPADMTHTFVDDVRAIIRDRARGYHYEAGHDQNAGLMDSSYKIPGGGLTMTAEDFARFAIALREGKLVKPETLTLM